MIFKVNFAKSLVSKFPNATYVSFCASKFNLGKQQFQDFMFDFLYERKILNVAPILFRCEVQNTYDHVPGVLIKCYIKNAKKTLFCKLEPLGKFQDKTFGYTNSKYNIKPNSAAQEALLNRLKATIQDEIDAQIIAAINIPASFVTPPSHPLDYPGVVRRTFVVNPLPLPMPEPSRLYYDHNADNLTLPPDRGAEGNDE